MLDAALCHYDAFAADTLLIVTFSLLLACCHTPLSDITLLHTLFMPLSSLPPFVMMPYALFRYVFAMLWITLLIPFSPLTPMMLRYYCC